jgi:hypothetical protein
MSQRDGDKARSNRQRKAKMHQRDRIRGFRKTTKQGVSKSIGRPNASGTEERIAVWENEGGSVKKARGLTGTVNQIAWANQIKGQGNAEFDRVANALRSAATKQSSQDRMTTQAIIEILAEKRAEVLANEQAGYFIHDWQELRDQVRRMIVEDRRYKAIKAAKGLPLGSSR